MRSSEHIVIFGNSCSKSKNICLDPTDGRMLHLHRLYIVYIATFKSHSVHFNYIYTSSVEIISDLYSK